MSSSTSGNIIIGTQDTGYADPWDAMLAYRRERDEARAERDRLKRERDDARALVAEVIAAFEQYAMFDMTPEYSEQRARWRERAGLTGDGDRTEARGDATDLRPREGEPGWHDVTCGSCGAEFSTNFTVDQMECAECEARRCPNCRTWFGSEE